MSSEHDNSGAAVWVVFAFESDGSGKPEFLAAYDGANARDSASALVDLVTRAGCYRGVTAANVPLWPLLKGP